MLTKLQNSSQEHPKGKMRNKKHKCATMLWLYCLQQFLD